MDIHVIEECTALSLAEQISFPEVVARLAATGVERYMVDLVGQSKSSYSLDGMTYHEAITLHNNDVAEAFDATAVKSAITDSQQGRIKYQAFLSRIMKAGCSHYEVFITGKKVIYCGRNGDQHIELFPTKP
ncbi:MAG: Phage envelope protein [Rickettsiales bacterium]|jgi:uncharacterized protein YbcV (DUF1398 family)|nr:Phage envelope protein [Rickettsiales bacterium]